MTEAKKETQPPLTLGQEGYQQLRGLFNQIPLSEEKTWKITRRRELSDGTVLDAKELDDKRLTLNVIHGGKDMAWLEVNPDGLSGIGIGDVYVQMGEIRVASARVLLGYTNDRQKNDPDFKGLAKPVANWVANMTTQDSFISAATLLSVEAYGK